MTVAELRKALEQYPEDWPVVLTTDNSRSAYCGPLAIVDAVEYTPPGDGDYRGWLVRVDMLASGEWPNAVGLWSVD